MATLPHDHLSRLGTRGDGDAAFELGMAYSSGAGGVPLDLVQAHRWLNVAALCGHRPAQAWRAEIAAEMSAGEIAAAQKLARGTVIEMKRPEMKRAA